MDNLSDRLSSILPSKRIKTREIDRIAYANDASYFRLVPQGVVQPKSVDEIRALFRFSQQQRIPMTFRAGWQQFDKCGDQPNADFHSVILAQ